jgi:2-succinyl-5-enolpyruvyl-6-hydroxy-3-cyclohexene-1-carboxylate synthase
MIYSSKKNVQQLAGLLKAHQVRQVVLSPGSRNTPVIQSLANDPFFVCHTVIDERSAGFYALGIAQYIGEKVAVCCTSGTAALNYGPAVAEACYQQIPLVFITADRPAAWIDQMAGQTLPQPGVFNALVKKSVHLPEIASAEDEWYCNRLINEALLQTTHHGCGPVHINIPLAEPLFDYVERPLPEVRTIQRYAPGAASFHNYGRRFAERRRPMILAGQSAGYHLFLHLNPVLEAYDCVVLAEHLANIPSPPCIRNFDAMLCSVPEKEWGDYAPDLLITTGGHVVSKRIRQLLHAHPPSEHWHIAPDAKIVDTYQCLTDVVEAEASRFIDCLSAHRPGRGASRPKPFSERWLARSLAIPEPEGEFSDMMAVGALMKALPDGAHLQLANSSSVRLAQLFRPAGRQWVFSNRGTSGIDGCLSTALGMAAVNRELTFLLIGDLAFFYDMNVLWNRRPSPNLRILLNNNGGGEIFYTLPGFGTSETADKHIAVRHTENAQAWAESQGFEYLPVSDGQELQAHMPAFVATERRRPVLMEVFSPKEKNVQILRSYYASLKQIAGE